MGQHASRIYSQMIGGYSGSGQDPFLKYNDRL